MRDTKPDVKRSFIATRGWASGVIKSVLAFPHRSEMTSLRSLEADVFWLEQGRRFRGIYEQARRDVPYYRDRPESYPADLGHSDDVRDMLVRLPILTKQEVRSHNDELFSTRASRSARIHTTSGTSGTPLRLMRSAKEMGYEQAVREDWMLHTIGARRPRTLALSGFFAPQQNDGGLVALTDHWERTLYLSIYRLGELGGAGIERLMNSFSPQLIEGYASGLHELARLLPAPIRAKRATGLTTSEVLPDEWRSVIEERLCDRVYDNYGSQEGAHRVMECREGGMHVHPAVGVVEILALDGCATPSGETGTVVVTGLVRKTMPLFRYALGDAAISTGDATDCRCGLAWPTIGAVQGRQEDYAISGDGSRVRYLGFHATKFLTGVVESQVEQSGLDDFIVRLVTEDGPLSAADEARVIKALRDRMRAPLRVRIHYVNAVPRTANGKFRAFVRTYSPSS